MTIGRNTPTPAASAVPSLQWSNGKPVGRDVGSTARFAPLVGFHLEVGRDGALDDALRVSDWPQVEIKHQRPGGSEIVRHWWLGEEIELLPLTSGPVAPTLAGCLAGANAAAMAEAGLAVVWLDGERSQLAVRGYVLALWEAGYGGLVQLSTRSRMTDALLAALIDHTRVAEVADSLSQKGHAFSPAELWLPLGAGAEAEWGRGDTATVVPLVSRHPATLDADYLCSLWRPGELWAAALAAWPGVQAWAREYPVQARGFDPATGEVTRREWGRH